MPMPPLGASSIVIELAQHTLTELRGDVSAVFFIMGHSKVVRR